MPVLKYRATVLKTHEQINEIVHGMAKDMLRICDDEVLYIACIMEGARELGYGLVRTLREQAPDKHVMLVPVWASSYGKGMKSSGKVDISGTLAYCLKNYNVFLVDDVADTRITLDEVGRYLKGRGVGKIWNTVLIDKAENKQRDVKLDVVGLSVPGECWIAGYGIDLDDHFRTNPNLLAIEDVRGTLAKNRPNWK